ncbi:DNA primase [Campylobacter jejuni]|uniref:DNA primase n=8 Tax=Campylobacter jejuni TaxID=197 RepID=DNAG_CAMJE|nr:MULTISPECIES: DNA primase [Campylobacter]YP_002345007.1 DNA primase [Campylobacter jejuni subsp. jejuni NCTC 11168 = ATCC 700819]Q9PM37.1 RecName: Full=DNA primase [Campylobacter jejuni subsp. jejuni NCTC 11168 = ATCC 700819]EDA4619305.1 DNA primase [Campylobacter coli]EFV06943.1 DNA primase [Campylobacter jejuni subsp. jejuni DFVF1099]WPM66646.1 DNA primase [Campylobacter sp. CFSAN122778]ADC29184.1 DNA primase [Campylobacter jejuni subsp. jejuni IA3902]AFU43640.1 DNA primase [Campylobact
MITKESIENLSQRLNIVDIIENYIEVKKQGSSFVCICPFHADKNPSMHINPIKGFYHCFACKAGGDAFKFVMDYEKLSFADAVEKVASLSNFTLSYTKEKQENKKELKSILPSLNAYFKDNLKHHKEVLTYLYQRALNDKDIAKFELGFAGASEDSIRLLQNQKIPLEDAMSVGALKKDENNEFYASFIWRITFPIYDHKDLLVGFGGRTLNPNVPAKYVNSPQNILFDKSRIFYAFNIAKENIAKKKEIIVCEGYMDAIAFHKAGFNNAVAVLGTALTEHHLPLIRRYDAKVILCFDNDEAGLKAATRSAFLLSTNKIDGKVAILQGGKDPAELVAKNESTKLHNILDEGIELGEFYIRRLISTHSIISALDKQKALETIQKFTFNLEPLVANSYTSLVSNLLKVDEKFIVLSQNSKKTIQTPLISQNKYNFPKEKIHIAELELIAFLKQHPDICNDFKQISDSVCFKHKILLDKILEKKGYEDSDIREFESKNIRKNLNYSEFLLGICKVNLAFLNNVKIKNSTLALKKQLFTLIDKNLNLLIKNLNTAELNNFLKEYLSFLKYEKNEEILQQSFRNLNGIFGNKNFTAYDLGFSIQNNDEPF